ncbi:hypothetical protein BSI_21440 [Bacillus inaquosorum KCTC 13429]|uniref:Uncharacterized protein n=1 Tax=Bacillus inaquosorum KCTC 13429 TaxID=1236548 RepID=A0A9W5PDM0_9BACI|nr:hypothetical protein BSI_21440 [Bacillus inaquosorum KCTC 13429]
MHVILSPQISSLDLNTTSLKTAKNLLFNKRFKYMFDLN